MLYLLISLITALHPIHISKCQMEVNTDSKTIEMTLHVFIDDLETSMKNAGYDKLYLGTEREVDTAQVLVGEFLKTKLTLSENNKAIDYQLIGYELSDDLQAFWCYMETENISKFTNLSVEYTLLMDVHDDQQNILGFIGEDQKEQYALCSAKEKSANFKF